MYKRTILIPLSLAVVIGLSACSTNPKPADTEPVAKSASTHQYPDHKHHDPQDIFLESMAKKGLDPQAVNAVINTVGKTIEINPEDPQWGRLEAQGLTPNVDDLVKATSSKTHSELGHRLMSVFICAPGTDMTPEAANQVKDAFQAYGRPMPAASWAPGSVAVALPSSSEVSDVLDHGLPCG